MKAIVWKNAIDSWAILGTMSLVFWTITLQTTIKYVVFTLKPITKVKEGILHSTRSIKKAKTKMADFSGHHWGLLHFR